jgi:tetratricopeptide (TPR) repeat protein
MKRCIPLLITTVVLLGTLQTSQAFDPPANGKQDGANLGQPLKTLPPLPALTAPEKPPAEVSPQAAQKAGPAQGHVAAAERSIQDGRYDLAIAAASRAISADPDNAASHRRLRARAYQLSGRYEEALADTNPLEVLVAAPRANLKSANDVVATVPQGAVLNVSQVRGDWLKVESIGGQKFEWAWVCKGDLQQGPPRRPPARIVVEPRRRAYYYGRLYGDYPPYHDYGRRYYDWQRHVPLRYWRYLPR